MAEYLRDREKERKRMKEREREKEREEGEVNWELSQFSCVWRRGMRVIAFLIYVSPIYSDGTTYYGPMYLIKSKFMRVFSENDETNGKLQRR